MLRGLKDHPRLVAGLVIAALAVGGGALAIAARRAPGEDLERLEHAQSDARGRSAGIAANLERIAANLAEARGLTEKSDEIHGLTVRQQRSLERLASLLRRQLAQLERSAQTLETTRGSAGELLRISDRQARAVAEAVAALRELEVFARHAGEVSDEVAVRARYGARLAEDSEKSFRGP